MNAHLEILAKSNNKFTAHVAQHILDELPTYDKGDEMKCLRDAQYGAKKGFCPELVYMDSSAKFYDQFENEFWDLVNTVAKECNQTPLQFIATLPNASKVCSPNGLKYEIACWAWFKSVTDIIILLAEGNEHKRRRAVVTFADGDVIDTAINGTIESITKYYAIGRIFNIGNVTDNMQAVKSLEISSID